MSKIDESKNIAIVIDSIGGGGAERVMLDLAQGIIEAGHRAFYIALEKRIDHKLSEFIPTYILYEDANLKKITRGRKQKMISSAKLKNLVEEIEAEHGSIDLFLSNLDPTNSIVSLCSFKNVKYVLHNSMEEEVRRELKLGPVKYFRKKKLKKIMNDKDLIAVSKGVGQEAKDFGLIKPKSVTMIYNPCDVDKIKKLSEQKLNAIPDFPYILHVGRVVKQKRHDVLFQALANVADIKIVCLCKDIEKAKKIAEKYGVENRVIFPGFTHNPYVWMKNARLMVLSSDFEGLGMVLLESLVCGTPVVSTDCKYGPSEILTGELSQFLSKPGDYKALASNINKALNEYPNFDNLTILNQVSLPNVVSQYLKLID